MLQRQERRVQQMPHGYVADWLAKKSLEVTRLKSMCFSRVSLGD